MNESHTNTVILGATPDRIEEYFRSRQRSAYISPISGRFTVVYDEQSEALELEALIEFTKTLSARLECPVLTAVDRGKSLLWYTIFENGRFMTGYDSSTRRPVQAARLSKIYGVPTLAPVVWFVLRMPHWLILSERRRHGLLVKLLGFPQWSVGSSFHTIKAGKTPAALNPTDLKYSV
ncbi:MAG TPA: hypothetical protein VJX67_13610 [Blastocatellia bacterium]|nr:hypothetical protein [Blastocatellia bacterium]